MQEIKGYDRSIQQLLSGVSYGIDYYQREYKWGRKQLEELVGDLTDRFLSSYQSGHAEKEVAGYNHYFLGSIVVSQKDDIRYIVDGQQRMTSLSILFIYLNNLQKSRTKRVSIETLIYADDFGEKKFKLNVPERNDCMEALFNDQPFNGDEASEAVRNLTARYQDLDEIFPAELRDEALLSFIYWLMHKVKLIEIIAFSDEDAYTIFETMNDRGLSLSPTDMLKGYLLANIDDADKRLEANKLIKQYLGRFVEYGRETEADFFKAWLRSQYSTTIREPKKHAKSQDFELIGTEYHRWVRGHARDMGLRNTNDFYQFVMRDFRYYAALYLRLIDATRKRTEGLESVRYNADAGFTLQHHVILAAVTPEDDKDTATAKAGVVADFLNSWLNCRLWNYKSNNYDAVRHAIFSVIRSIRGKSLSEIRSVLYNRLIDQRQQFDFSKPVRFNQFTSKAIHRQLARFTDWLERQSGEPGRYEDYMVRYGKNAYEIEHIWANHYDRFKEEFEQQNDFDNYRNLVGGLLLLPKKINASLNDMTYMEKLPKYLQANPLTQSLHKSFYQNNPGFQQAIARHALPFRHHEVFAKADLEERSRLYCQLAALIWSPDRLLGEGRKNLATGMPAKTPITNSSEDISDAGERVAVSKPPQVVAQPYVALSEIRPGGKPPGAIAMPDGTEYAVRYWKDILTHTVTWLWDRKLLSDHLPVSTGRGRYIVNRVPQHPKEKFFRRAYQIRGLELFVETNINGGSAIEYAGKVLRECGQDPEQVRLQVRDVTEEQRKGGKSKGGGKGGYAGKGL